MQLTYADTRYIACTTYEERDLPKRAGFRWDPENKRWWTQDRTTAAKLAAYADETCQASLSEAAATHQQALAASKATDATIDVPAPEGLEYLPFQRAGIAFASARSHTLIADEMGLGKTIEAIGLINADEMIRRVLVICPASLRLNWQRELQRWLTRPLTVGIATSKALLGTDITVINFDILHNHTESLRAEPYDLLVVDECHLAKNPTARRTVQILGTDPYKAKKAKVVVAPIPARRKLFLTGTPIVNRPKELFPLIHALDPQAWPNFFGYGRRYCAAHQVWTGREYVWDFGGASHLDELQDKLRSTIMLRRLKKDVLTELPPKRRQVIEIPANGAGKAVAAEQAAWARHQDTLTDLRAAVELAKASDDPEVYARAVEGLREGTQAAFTEISVLRHETALAKVPAVIEHLHTLLDEGEAKVVLFAHHHDVVAALAAEFGESAVVLTGETAMQARQVAVDRFQTDQSCTLFIGSITAAGVGLTLTASAHVVFAELDWVPGNVTQAEDRTHRIGQHESVLIQHLVLEGSLDATMARTLIDKQRVIEAALDTNAPTFPVLPHAEDGATMKTGRAGLETIAAGLTPEQVAAIHTALRSLAAMCDGAQALDGHGFNKLDARVGHSLAACASLSPRQAALGQLIVRKYHRQLGGELIALTV